MAALALFAIAMVVVIAGENASAQRPPHRAWLISLGFIAAVILVSAAMVMLGRALPS